MAWIIFFFRFTNVMGTVTIGPQVYSRVLMALMGSLKQVSSEIRAGKWQVL